MDKNYMEQIQKEASDSLSLLTNEIIITWLGSMFLNITFVPLSDEDVKEMRALLDEDNYT